ncbi:geranylgeranyl reductase [Mycolicibacterium moriokaense]|uniref:Geranylgeranyl reductase n=1 Tax=Mycolicibacterium moriokaense TaxID=39691 RepID=A0AAD1M694_9MYCO|nr:geranylgeranyl reductase family protein [Mycolicibacterium moriokaense]MCV7038356.1 geranylgeranyl reductase family protein [Mycolicibacterium moriokaense]ORB13679.1 geranylgeranyl reductase [Mycolicibacterium moriokaense]BBX02522.1 geranylgeranyl reductase [Mycolicibacterium moriokaense]
MTQHFDLAISGGGPAGAAAAWQAVQAGARVVVLDKAQFPRDKPCGDGLTPRAVSYLQKMGLAERVNNFHRVNGARIFSPSEWNLSFPHRPGMPDHGHVARRTELDTMLLEHVGAAGAEVRQSAEVVGPALDDNGRVVGVILANGERINADAVIAADGAYSPLKRVMKLESQRNGYSAIAIRAEMPVRWLDTDTLDIHLKLVFNGDQLPGYGWVFPLGGGRANIGLGYCTSYKHWRDINAAELLKEFLATLPAEWELPPVSSLRESKALQAWRLPMGFTTWPPWRPGILFAGDALGAARPVSGAGISKALQSGLAAGECAVASLTNGGPDDFTNYEQVVEATWGKEYRRGRFFHKLVGIPAVANAGVKVLDTVSHPGIRSHLLFWEAWRDPKAAEKTHQHS